MKKITIYILLFLGAIQASAQNNTGTPYSLYGIGLIPENYGSYSAMGGVSAAMRDNVHINFMNPAAYTAMDSLRFYFQFGVTGEYVDVSTTKENTNYRVAQNAALNMGFRFAPKMYASFGFNQRSDIGYDLLYRNQIVGDPMVYYNQHIQGEGGLNDIYLGLAYQYKKLSVGLNTSYVFGNLERQQSLVALVENSSTISSRTRIHVSDVIFNIGMQYGLLLTKKSNLTLGTSFNFGSKLNAEKDFLSYKTTGNSQAIEYLVSEKLNNGNISYPFRITGGLNYEYKDKWQVAGDYTFQKMSNYEEFGDNQKYNDYHKVAMGASFRPNQYSRFWWQRNKYMVGSYFTKSHIELRGTDINTYGVTFGAQMPILLPYRELHLGVAFDLGIRGTTANKLIQEKYAKLRVNIVFKEAWFLKRKIN